MGLIVARQTMLPGISWDFRAGPVVGIVLFIALIVLLYAGAAPCEVCVRLKSVFS